MKSVIISIQPYWAFLIIAKTMGWDIPQEKTIEVMKSYPKDKEWNKVTHIYCSKDRKSFNRIPKQYQPFMKKLLGKVIGEFVCDRIYEIKNLGSSFMIGNDIALTNRTARESCLEFPDLRAYLEDKNGYAWHISELKIYDKPKELREFKNLKCDPIKNAYQSWGYVEE